MTELSPSSASGSVEDLTAAVQAAMEHLPTNEVHASLDHLRAASELLYATFLEDPSESATQIIETLELAERSGNDTTAYLEMATTALTAYLTGQPANATTEAVGEPAGGIGAAVEEHPLVQAAREEAEEALDRLFPMLGHGRVARYNTELDELSDGALCELMRVGMPGADEALIRRYDRLLWRMANNQFAYSDLRAVDAEDLWVAGVEEFLASCRRHDPSHGYKLSTYAITNAHNAMKTEAMATGHNVHIPFDVQYKIIQKIRAENDRRMNTGRPPMTDEEIGERFNMEQGFSHGSGPRRVGDIRQAMLLTTHLGSLHGGYSAREMGADRPFEDDRAMESVTADEPPKTDEEAIKSELVQLITQILDTLPGKEARFIRLRFGLDGQGERSVSEAARELGLTPEGGRKMQGRVLRKLREPVQWYMREYRNAGESDHLPYKPRRGDPGSVEF